MSRILVFSQDFIGKAMAGPGIRSWELALALSRTHDVTLAAPNQPDVHPDTFRLISYSKMRVDGLIVDYDLIITQVISPAMVYMARKHNTKMILDAFDPMLLEDLEIYHDEPMAKQRYKNHRSWTENNLSLLVADAIICASEKQRDLWLGALMALDRVRPEIYSQDITMRSLIDVVPFGLREQNPVKKPGADWRAKLGLKPTDTVLLWAGGIYEWYDSDTLIRAMAIIAKQRDDIKLPFVGLKHPNSGVLEFGRTARTKQLADELGLTGKTVTFSFERIAYEDWPSYLLATDIGLSTHFNHIETRFSFRTRVIDSYLWGLKPIITTKGDAMADFVQMHDIGRVVEYEDAPGLAQAIMELADNKKVYAAMQERMRGLRDEYRWSRVVQPVLRMSEELLKQPRRRYTRAEIKLMFMMYYYILVRVRQDKGLWRVFTNVGVKTYKLTLGRLRF